jgi:hypothetical protein
MRTFALLLGFFTPAAGFAADADLMSAYAQLREAALDPQRVATVNNLELKKDAATFRLKSGTLYFLKPVLDRPAGAVFLGDAVLSFKPPAQIEQKYMARFLNGESQLEEPFKEAVFLFADATAQDLAGQLQPAAGDVPSRANSLLGDFRNTFRNDVRTNIEARVLAGLTSPLQVVFMADIRGQKHGRLLFSVDPMSEEDVSLAHYLGARVGADQWSSYTGVDTPTADYRALVHTAQIEIDTEVEKGGRIQATSTSQFTALVSGPRMLPVLLAPSLRVSKVTGCDGAELKFIQEPKRKDADLWVILPKPLVKDETCTWKFTYAGDEVVKNAGNGNFYVGARENWYPKISNPGELFSDRTQYHLKFASPKDYVLVATGKPGKSAQEGKLTLTEWSSELPYTVAGFNYGKYKTKTIHSDDREVTVYANQELGDEMRELQILLERNPQAAAQLGITAGGLNTTGLMNQTAVETANALKLFTAYFGPIPYKSISITQQPSGVFGQSWPSLVFMPYTSFLDATMRHQLGMDQDAGSRKFFQEVGSHEVSHQWWGHVVGWKSYHDQWLSEGFAQFSAGLYAQKAQGEKKYKTFLETDRQMILSPLPQSTIRANDAGPIWMGQRLDTEKTRAAYNFLVYSKGGFVLHMLRMLLYDFVRNDDSRFIALMKDFVQTYYNKAASTEDFKAICDKHFKMDMGWFFRQWVYGTDLPKISVEYSFGNDPGGAVLWKVDIRQQNVPEGFISSLPFVMKTKSGVLAGTLGTKELSKHLEVKLKEKPDSVEINPFYAWLCELDVKKR